jgi:DNA-directed RNA polymerase alpha subunit
VKNFIEITNAKSGNKALVNIAHIEFVCCENSDFCRVYIDYKTEGYANRYASLTAKESFNQVKNLIAEAQGDIPETPIIDEKDEELEHLLNTSIDYLELSTRASRCLRNYGIETIRQLVSHSAYEISRIRKLGNKSLAEIKKQLAYSNLSLKEEENK